jgi:hypothetical protein
MNRELDFCGNLFKKIKIIDPFLTISKMVNF